SPDSDSGVQGDTATNETTPDFRGTAEPLATVTVRAGTSLIATTLADELGNWSAAYIAAPLSPGFHAVTASIVDLAGNVSVSSAAFGLDVDTSSPLPTITAVRTASGPVTGTTTDNRILIDGTSEALAAVEIWLNEASVMTLDANASGEWSLDYRGTPLPDGPYSITAQATDQAGNLSAMSAAVTFTVNTNTTPHPLEGAHLG